MSKCPKPVARPAAVLLVAAGALICAGWQLRISALKGECFGTFVAPNAALMFVLVGVSVLLHLNGHLSAARAATFFLTLFSAVIVFEHLSRTNLGIDGLFFAHRMSDWTIATVKGRPALPTVLAFFFAGMSLLTLRMKRNLSDWCASVVAGISYLSLMGYAYTSAHLYGHYVALPTAILLGLVAFTLWTARPQAGFAELVASDGAGGVVLRRVLFSCVVLFSASGYVRLRAEQLGYVGRELATATMVVLAVFLLTVVTLLAVRVLNAEEVNRKRVEQSLIRAEKLAATGRMAATLAHEINNPLAAVMNLLYLASAADGTEAKDYIQVAEREVRRASEITKRTLGFFREDAKPIRISLVKVVQEVIDTFQTAKLNGYPNKVHQDFQSTAFVYARVGEIRQIISNLLGNAIDAVEDTAEPSITLMLRERSGSVALSVRDNGCGITMANRDRIFEPFFTTKASVGTGLGLYVSKQLAEKNGGSLEVESCAGEGRSGTTFSLTLPIASPEAVPQPEAAEQARAHAQS